MLVGNKTDLRKNDVFARSNKVFVKMEEVYAMAVKIGAHTYVECSAKQNDGVKEVFQTAALAISNKQKEIM